MASLLLCPGCQQNEKCAAPADLARDPDAASVTFDDGLGDRQTQTRSGARRIRSIEAVEEMRLGVLWNAGTVVGDFEQHTLRGFLAPYRDAGAGRGVLVGVDNEVQQGLPQIALIAVHP